MKTDEETGKEVNFDKGGNKEEFQGMIGDGKGVETEECTQIGWSGTAQDMILFQVIEAYKNTKSHSVLDEKTCKVGVSFKAHKRLMNVFQILYIKQDSNQIA